jgi:formylglycine-generating enzyme required for sulfatase activity/tRNA A-37 threonylcarbamoyl transferase component Bud32
MAEHAAKYRFAHYEILLDERGKPRLLGKGAMGYVYRARDTRLKRDVALKVISSKMLAHERTIARFEREVEAMAKIDDPHVVHIEYFGQHQRTLFYSMTLCDGPTLRQLLDQRGALPLNEALKYTAHLVSALHALDRAGLVHRDLKASNVLMFPTRDGGYDARLTDFGVVHDQNQETLAKDEDMVGTLAFASPEQIAKKRTLDIRSDFYSLGGVLWCMLTGMPPFTGDSYSLIYDVSFMPPPFDVLPLGLPPKVQSLLAKLLAKQPEERPQSVAELEKLVAEIQADLAPVVNAPPVNIEPGLAHAERETTRPGSTFTRQLLKPGGWRWPQYSGLALAASALLALGLWAGGFFAEPTNDQPRPEAVVNVPQPATAPITVPTLALRDELLAGEELQLTVAPSTVMTFVWCPATGPQGFAMGSPPGEVERKSNEFQHPVVLTRGFWIGKYLTTQEELKAVLDISPSYFRGKNLPAETVIYDEALAFCANIERRLQLPASEKAPGKLRVLLPTEAQWEYACRAGKTTPFGIGDGQNIGSDLANFDGNFPYGTAPKGPWQEKTMPVDSYPPNSWGVHDMHGNVWQWCRDYFGDYVGGKNVDPTGPATGTNRVIRGGSWERGGRFCRSAYRGYHAPDNRHNYCGFRVILVVE